MLCRKRCGKINVKALVILILVIAGVGVSLVAARQIRRTILSRMDLKAGQAAFERQDWHAAVTSLREYLGRNPDDVEVLKRYAQALLGLRPLEAAPVAAAITTYRRIMQLAPLDDLAYGRLATLYTATGNFEDLAYIARTRLGHVQNDRTAPLWLADALTHLNRTEEARQTLEKLIGEIEAIPDKHDEYVKACAGLSRIMLAGASMEAKTKALEWLNKAADHAPESAVALANRARFYRETPDVPGVAAEDRLPLARKDLEAADKLGTADARIRFLLGSEWMGHNDLDRAAAELQAADGITQEAIAERFLDLSDWKVARFLLASEIAGRRGAAADGAALANDALTVLTEKRHRVQALPSAIVLYVHAGKVAEARRCLDEYLEILRAQQGAAQSPARLGYLKALVARAQDNPYAVINALEPVLLTDVSQPELWRLLAEAYSQTDQSRRAVNALIKYLRHHPRDPEMTLQLAKEYLKLRDWNRAFETARLAEPLDPMDYTIRLLRIEASVYVAEQQQQLDAARLRALSEELAALRAEHPDRVDIRILQAVVATHLGHSDEAEAELKLAIEECKEPLRAEMQLARHYYRAKSMDKAIGVCEAACKRHSDVAEPWTTLSSLYVTRGDHDSALACLRQGLGAATGKWERRSLSMELAMLEIMHGDRTTGIRLLSDLASQDEHEIRARALLLGIREVREDRARAQALVGELRRAEEESGLWWRLYQASLWLSSDDWRLKQQDTADLLRSCIVSDPEWSAPALLLADMYEKLGDVKQVEETCRQALARNPSATDVADRLMTLFEKQGRFVDAEEVSRQTEANSKVVSDWHVRTAIRTGNFSRAIDELRLRVSNDDRDASSRILLARLLYWQTRDTAQALEYIRQAEAITPGSLSLIAVKAAILRAEGQVEEARRILDDYVSTRKDFAAYLMRAAYLVNEGQLEQAEQDYRKLTTFTQNGTTGYGVLGGFYARTRDLDKAVATMEEGLKAYPEDLTLERYLMKLLFQRARAQDRERAIEILGSLEKRLPQDPELMKLRAMLMLERPTPESAKTARTMLENAVRLEPTAVDAHLTLCSLAMQARDYQAARDFAIQALGSSPGNPALLLARARAEMALENTPLAVELAHLVLHDDPNDTQAIDVLVEAGQRTNDRHLLDEARLQVESAVHRDPAKETLLLARCRVLTSLELPKAAIPEMEAYCQSEAGGRSMAARVTLADLYRLAGDMAQAEKQIRQAEQLDPNSQTVVHARFLWLVAQNRFEELAGISSAYLAAKDQDPTMILAAASTLASSDSMKLKKEGLRLFEQGVALSPMWLDARLGLASILYQTGDVPRAEKVYHDLLADYPNDIRILNDLAWVLQEQDHQYEAALKLADRGLELAPKDLHLLDTRGTILSHMPDRLAAARTDFERLLELAAPDSPQQAKALLQLGRICVKLKDPAQARQYQTKAAAIDQKIHVLTSEERAEIARINTNGTP